MEMCMSSSTQHVQSFKKNIQHLDVKCIVFYEGLEGLIVTI